MSKERERFAKDALKAHEQGNRIIAGRLNAILEKHAPELRVRSPAPEPGLTLADATLRLRNALLGLRPFVPDLPDESRIAPWSLGHINGLNNRPELVGLVGFSANENECIGPALRFLDENRDQWPAELWQRCIIEPVERHAAEWRRWLLKLELMVRLDSAPAIQEYIRELRIRWPAPDDCQLPDPAGIVEQLWAAMYRLGMSPPSPPRCVPSADLFAARIRDGAEARAVLAEQCRNFHDALNIAEQAARVGLSTSVNVGEGIRPIKRPSENALKAWRLRDLSGITNQTELAAKLTEQGTPATQGQVSRWLKETDDYLKAGKILPELPVLHEQPQSIDPAVIDMGERQDHRTPRQRPSHDPDAD